MIDSNNSKKKVSLPIIVALLLIISIATTYALFKFRSVNTNVNVISKGLDYYINYQAGTSILSSDNQELNVSWDYTGGISSTIEFWKNINTPYDIYGYLYMDIKAIGTNLKLESALKWAIVNNGSVLGQGTFLNRNVGDTISLVYNKLLLTTADYFTVYIWLDDNALSNYGVIGETISVEIRAEASQAIRDTNFAITNFSNPQVGVLNASAVSSDYDITAYAIEKEETEVVQTTNINKNIIASTLEKNNKKIIASNISIEAPTEWIELETPTKNLNVNYYPEETGMYRLFVRNAINEITTQSLEVTLLDTNAPIIELNGDVSTNTVNSKSTITIPLSVTDTDSGVDINSFTAEDIYVSVDNMVIPVTKNLTYNSVTNEVYSYTLTLSNITSNGSLTLSIPENSLKDNADNKNALTMLNLNVTVDNISPINNSISINSGAEYTNTTSVTLTLASTGASTMCISNTAVCTNYITYNTTYSYTLSSTNGTQTVYAYFKDTIGNISQVVSDTIIYDNIAPVIERNGNASAAYANSSTTITIPLSVTDITSGIDPSTFTESDVIIQVGDTIGVIPTTKTLTFNTVLNGVYSYTLTLSGLTGNGTLYLRLPSSIVLDNATNGNTGYSIINSGVTIDNAGPTISSIPVTPDIESLHIKVNATDTSGIANYYFSINNTTFYSSTNNTYTFTSLATGTYTIYVYAVDSFNNQSSTSTTTATVTDTEILRLTNTSIDGSTTNRFPTKGSYTVATNCTNATSSFDLDTWHLKISNINTSSYATCTPAFTTKTKTYLNSYIKDTLTGTTQGNGQVVNENGYRYEGTNPNNYILFNGELWRIIGVFDSSTHGITSTYLTKIIRNDSIGGWAWDSLYNLLNTYYYSATNGTSSGYCYQYSTRVTGNCDFTTYGIQSNYRSMIQNVTWYLGGYSSDSMTTDASYEYERGTTVYSGRLTSTTGYIGLIYPSDYGYGVLSTSCVRTTNLNSYSSASCAGSNWLKKETNEWTLMHSTANSNRVFQVVSSGNIGSYITYLGYSSRPVLYLKSTVLILSGTGTMADPYIIGM